MVTIGFEPPMKLTTSFYHCDSTFKTDVLETMLKTGPSYGFVVIDGSEILIAKLSSNDKEICTVMSVDLPNKHRNGGQSQNRFARLRIEARGNYITKCSDLLTKYYITNDKSNVDSIFIGGPGEMKFNLAENRDQRIKLAEQPITISSNGETGLNELISLVETKLTNIPLIAEKTLLSNFFKELSLSSGKVCYGFKNINEAYNIGAVDFLIISENATFQVHESESETLFGNFEGETDIYDWILINQNKVKIVSNKLQEGNQFLKGFGGIGAVLRYSYVPHEDISKTENNLNDDDFM